MTAGSDYISKLLLVHLVIAKVSAVTTPVQIEGVAPSCTESETNELDDCSCEKWHLLWSADKVRNNQCHFHPDISWRPPGPANLITLIIIEEEMLQRVFSRSLSFRAQVGLVRGQSGPGLLLSHILGQV